MPRSKADRTVIHRIEMGGWERERFETFLTVKQIQLLGEPLTRMVSTLPGLAALYLVLNALLPNWSFGLSPSALKSANDSGGAEGLADYLETQNIILGAAGVAAAGTAVVLSGGLALIPSILALAGGFLGGQVVAEGAEELYQDAEIVSSQVKPAFRIIKLMLGLRSIAIEQGMDVE